MPTSAAIAPPPTNASRIGMPGTRSMKLYDANAPTAMNAAVPSESWPAYPVRMLRPSAASEKIRNGMRIAVSQYWLPTTGTTTNASAASASIAMRSCRIGKTCWSCAYETLNWPASR